MIGSASFAACSSDSDRLPLVPLPERRPIHGRYVRLEPLDCARHGDQLWQSLVAGADADPNQWDHIRSDAPFTSRADFDAHLADKAVSTDYLFSAVVDLSTQETQGTVCFLDMIPEQGSIEIGVNFGRAMQRSRRSTEAVYLLLKEAFALGYRRVEWICGIENDRSKRAADRFGFSFEGVFEEEQVNGMSQEVSPQCLALAQYSILASEWPALNAAFVRWLAADNFDESGRQKTTLAEMQHLEKVPRSGLKSSVFRIVHK